VNKVPRKKGYVPNMYTGRSMMYNGGKKKMTMGGMGTSRMDEDMMGKMRTQMMGGGKKYGMMHGGVPHGDRMMKGHGGKASSDIYAMETACNKMAGYNMSLPKGR
tara:strand:+ start:457 stop:771 length:315 start_codon:yes stop_codon:yes gene_type:complete